MPAGAELLALDTSVGVPLLAAHVAGHAEVRSWVGDRPVRMCGHAHLELYAVLTRLPGAARVEAADAARLMEAELGPPVLLDARAQATAPSVLAAAGVGGGATYDGLVALAAVEHGVTLVSRDARAEAVYRRLGAVVQLLRLPPEGPA